MFTTLYVGILGFFGQMTNGRVAVVQHANTDKTKGMTKAEKPLTKIKFFLRAYPLLFLEYSLVFQFIPPKRPKAPKSGTPKLTIGGGGGGRFPPTSRPSHDWFHPCGGAGEDAQWTPGAKVVSCTQSDDVRPRSGRGGGDFPPLWLESLLGKLWTPVLKPVDFDGAHVVLA